MQVAGPRAVFPRRFASVQLSGEDRRQGAMSTTKGSGVRMDLAGDIPPVPAPTLPTPTGHGRRPRPDALVAVCLLVLFGFPVMAMIAARHEPVVPRAEILAGAIPSGAGGKVHAVPGFAPGGPVATALQGSPPRAGELDALIRRAASPLFDATQQQRLMQYVRQPFSP